VTLGPIDFSENYFNNELMPIDYYFKKLLKNEILGNENKGVTPLLVTKK
jgi:hypothetical protein